jgi:hypothetical protein
MRVATPARRWPCLLVLGLLSISGFHALADDAASEARLKKDIFFLASPECEGRGPGTKGLDKAADYIAHEFKKAGLKPGGKMNSYFQPFTVTGSSKLAGPGSVILRGPLGQEIELKADVDFKTMSASGGGKVDAPLVFIGYGASAPSINYDDYKGIDVSGKVVILLRKTPRWNRDDLPFDGANKDFHAEIVRKVALAESNRAAAVIMVNDHTDGLSGDKLMPFTQGGGSKIPAVQVRRNVVSPILHTSLGMSLRDIELAIDRDLQPRSAALKGWTAAVETKVARTTHAVKNVIGYLDGKGPLAKEIVVVGAHYDHLGVKGNLTYFGADDNGSGSTAVMELARRFAAMKDRDGRKMVFMTFSAEEMGLLGSQHFCNVEPLFPLADVAAMVNLDMVGRLPTDGKQKLLVEGTGTSKTFDALVEKLNSGFQYSKNRGVSGFSDHAPFYRKKIPVIMYWTGTHKDYHKPTDTADRINVPGMRKVTDLAEKTLTHLATVPERPDYIEVKSASKSAGGGPKGPKLGIIPNYDENTPGLLVGGVAAGGAADKAGLKEGDLIVEIGGKQITNIQTYMAAMSTQKVGQPTEIVVVRGKDRLKLKATPQ